MRRGTVAIVLLTLAMSAPATRASASDAGACPGTGALIDGPTGGRDDTLPTNPLAGLIDPDRIGAVGMSLGGMTVSGLVSNTCCRDRRVNTTTAFWDRYLKGERRASRRIVAAVKEAKERASLVRAA